MPGFTSSRRNGAKACWCAREPSISEILAEPIVRAVMEADGVKPYEVWAMLRNASGSVLIGSRRRKTPWPQTPF